MENHIPTLDKVDFNSIVSGFYALADNWSGPGGPVPTIQAGIKYLAVHLSRSINTGSHNRVVSFLDASGHVICRYKRLEAKDYTSEWMLIGCDLDRVQSGRYTFPEVQSLPLPSKVDYSRHRFIRDSKGQVIGQMCLMDGVAYCRNRIDQIGGNKLLYPKWEDWHKY